MTEETCLGEVAGSGHTAGLEGLIKGSELPGMGRVGLRQGLWLGVLAQEGVDVLNININKIKMKHGGLKQMEKRINKISTQRRRVTAQSSPVLLRLPVRKDSNPAPLGTGSPISYTHATQLTWDGHN